MYPVSVRDCTSSEDGVLGTSVEDFTLKSALLLLTLISARELLKISVLFHITPRKIMICCCFC